MRRVGAEVYTSHCGAPLLMTVLSRQTLQRLSVQRAIGLLASHGTVTHVDVCGCRQNDFPHLLVAVLVSRRQHVECET